jgi:predicted DNA-binding transcriptional regulator YafY
MRTEFGAPLEYDAKRYGFHYTDVSYQMPLLQLTEGELVALLVASQMMRQYRGTPFEQEIGRALRRIAEVLPDRVEVSLDDLSQCLSVLPRVGAEYDPVAFRTLLGAVRHGRQVRMAYWTAGRNEMTDRVVDPYDLALAPDDDWCLLGYCHSRRDVRLFKVQRVRSVEETGEVFCRPEGFRAADFMAGTFGTIRGDGDYDVVLRFSKAYAGLIQEKEWHRGQVVEPQANGTLLLKLHVNDLRLVRRWVLYWGTECQVLEPAELRQMIIADLKSLSRLYRPERR